jgi:methylglutaconyl-CoA hydratase
MPDLVLTTVADGCATVTMNRPEARNALSLELIEALDGAIETVGHDADTGDVRVVVLGGAGKSFCAGMDLKAVMSDPPGMRRMLRALSRAMQRIRALPVPTIARVQGAAVGGGCGLMVVTDFTTTHSEAKIGYPEVGLGLCPAVVAPWLMRRIRQAHELGLATHLFDRDRLDAETSALAAHLGEGSHAALAATKRWLGELEGELDGERLDKGADISADVLAGDQAQARLRARFG